MVHEAGETARSALSIFKDQPLVLGLILMNLALLGYMYYESMSYTAERKAEFNMLYRNRREVSVLLARCNWPEGQPLPKMFNEDELAK